MAEPITLVLGQEIEHNGLPHLVVRIIEKSTSLFQNPDGTCYMLEESYAELRGTQNEVVFITLLENQTPFSHKKSSIKALNPLNWRVKS